MARCASALDLPDYAAVMVEEEVVEQISKSLQLVCSTVSLSRPLPEEWVIVCVYKEVTLD